MPLENLDAFFEVSGESEPDYEFTVAWLDGLARGRRLGRGLFYRGNFAPPQFDGLPLEKSHLNNGSGLAVPIDLPGFSLNRLSVAAFNWLYYRVNLINRGPGCSTMIRSSTRWTRCTGGTASMDGAGFLQFQCVVPHATARDALREILERSAREVPSFLNVLKTFGSVPSPGWMSFPRPGVTLALDFANRGERTWRLVAELDRVTREAGGAVYPAKDARMSAENFAAYFPQLERFKPYVDPAFSSSFWRRVNRRALRAPSPLPGRGTG